MPTTNGPSTNSSITPIPCPPDAGTGLGSARSDEQIDTRTCHDALAARAESDLVHSPSRAPGRSGRAPAQPACRLQGSERDLGRRGARANRTSQPTGGHTMSSVAQAPSAPARPGQPSGPDAIGRPDSAANQQGTRAGAAGSEDRTKASSSMVSTTRVLQPQESPLFRRLRRQDREPSALDDRGPERAAGSRLLAT
jgi:hypothetical protein